MSELKTVLHVGCGPRNPAKLHETFRTPEWREIRLDINEKVAPDIIGSITDMHMVADASMDAVWSSHNLEHLYPHEVPRALGEFSRVLKADGFALITLPDLQRVAELIAEDKLDEPAYQSPAGPITPLDILYGLRKSLAAGNLYMAHRTGFTAKTLGKALINAGFAQARLRRDDHFNLWAVGYKKAQPKPPAAPEVAEPSVDKITSA
ncbi:MAG: methyltransferase domain-containing protein [Methylococcaceae bacterium]|nr:MAG: methyltransferase domain-containing protein [Methylococcaceae bacterium]